MWSICCQDLKSCQCGWLGQFSLDRSPAPACYPCTIWNTCLALLAPLASLTLKFVLNTTCVYQRLNVLWRWVIFKVLVDHLTKYPVSRLKLVMLKTFIYNYLFNTTSCLIVWKHKTFVSTPIKYSHFLFINYSKLSKAPQNSCTSLPGRAGARVSEKSS